MRKSFIIRLSFFLLALVLVSVSGCTGILSQKSTFGSVIVSLPSANNARSANINPPYTIDDICSYRLLLSPSEGEPLIITADSDNTSVIFDEVIPGTYTLTLQALQTDGLKVAQGISGLITVTAGKSSEAEIAMDYCLSPYTVNSCAISTSNPSVAALLTNRSSILSFEVSEASPLIVTDGNQVTRPVTSLADIDISNYESGTYIPFITADNEVVLIRDYAEGTEFAEAYIDNGNIVSDDGAASGFASGKYVSLANDLDPRANTWEYVTHFKTASVVASSDDHQTIKGNETDGDGFYACIWYGKFSLCVGTRGNPWTMTDNNFEGKHMVLSNQDYYVRIRYTGDAYTFEYSTDSGNTYTLDMVLVKSAENSSGYNDSGNYSYMVCNASAWNTIVPDRPRFGAHETGNIPFAGEFYMNDAYIKISDEYYWTGAYGYTSAARMDISGVMPVLRRMTANGAVEWDAIPLTGASVTINNGVISAITQPAVSE